MCRKWKKKLRKWKGQGQGEGQRKKIQTNRKSKKRYVCNAQVSVKFSFLLHEWRFTCHTCVIFDRPVSSYAMFFRDTQAVIKGHNPAATFGDISKIVAAMWDNLDDKTKAVSL